jgi:hypothetical protein
MVTYLIERHSEKCWFFNRHTSESGRVPWVCPESIGITPPGHKKRKSLFVFRCNCPECPAKLGVSYSVMHKIWEEMLKPFAQKGAPKKFRGGTR